MRVLRLVEGDEIEVIDGAGTLYRCRIAMAHAKHCGIEILSQKDCPPHWGSKIMVAVAPTKNLDRIEWMAEKCTEMGIDRITPLLCRHSERKVLKTERLHKILVAAMKQSLKALKPATNGPTAVRELLQRPFDGQKFIAYCDGDNRTPLHNAYKPGSNALILIGPEGDFSPEEVQLALAEGFIPVTLGESRLRTETAAMAATAFFNLIN